MFVLELGHLLFLILLTVIATAAVAPWIARHPGLVSLSERGKADIEGPHLKEGRRGAVERIVSVATRRWWALATVVLLALFWLLPISGQVSLMLGSDPRANSWPQIRVDPLATALRYHTTLKITDLAPWPHVLLTVNGKPVPMERVDPTPGNTWTWQWAFKPAEYAVEEGETSTIIFYRNCDSGCRERGRAYLGWDGQLLDPSASAPVANHSTKLGAVFADPRRDWHGRSGWTVELAYARQAADEPYWNYDDLAARTHAATSRGLRVLLWVEHDRGQSVPPPGDTEALAEYLGFLRRLARDDRFRDVYGFMLGSGFNAIEANAASPSSPVTPTWYARVFNGYGEDVSRTDNAVQVIKAENPLARVLAGPVRPWIVDQDGERRYAIDVPWLNYAHTLVWALDQGARAKAEFGAPNVGPDGFALEAPGRPGAPELGEASAAEEPLADLRRERWGGARAGFQVYRDWLDIINSYPATRGLPAYITSTNTHAPDDGVAPAENYPEGWLTSALRAVEREPQLRALCWFVDGSPADARWVPFSLGAGQGALAQAAAEFDRLLRGDR